MHAIIKHHECVDDASIAVKLPIRYAESLPKLIALNIEQLDQSATREEYLHTHTGGHESYRTFAFALRVTSAALADLLAIMKDSPPVSAPEDSSKRHPES